MVAAVGIVAAGVISRSSDAHEAQSWSDARSVPTVHLIAVKASAASDGLTLPGTMEAWNAARLYARVGGYVKDWYKDIGADVASGAPLGSIDTPELDQQIAQARASLASARANASLAKTTAARWNDLPPERVGLEAGGRREERRSRRQERGRARCSSRSQPAARPEGLCHGSRALRRRGDRTQRRHRRSRRTGCEQPAADVRGRRRAPHPSLCQRAADLFGGDEGGPRRDVDGAGLSGPNLRRACDRHVGCDQPADRHAAGPACRRQSPARYSSPAVTRR